MATAWQRLRPWWFTGLGLGVASLSDRLLVVGILVWVGLAIAAAAVALGTLRGTHRAPAMPPPAPARRRLDQVVLLVLLLAAVTVGTLGGAPMFEARE